MAGSSSGIKDFFSSTAAKGLFGVAGAYGANKNFRKGVNSFLFGEAPSVEQLQNLTPEQMQALSHGVGLMSQSAQPGGAAYNAQNYYAGILQPGSQAYENFSQPYLQEFQEKLLPMIEERYAGAGALSSSGFGQAVGGAASGLQSSLAQLFSQLQQQAASGATSQYGQFAQTGLTSPYTHYENPGKQGFAAQLIAALIKAKMGGGG
jgi:hypothetical protein